VTKRKAGYLEKLFLVYSISARNNTDIRKEKEED
jgi:hypothetical protein